MEFYRIFFSYAKFDITNLTINKFYDILAANANDLHLEGIMKKIFAVLVILLLVSSIFVGCVEEPDDGKITVAVSIVPEAAFVKAVCGDLVYVVTAVPAGYSPATYEPTALEMVNITKADAYFSIGVPAENSFLSYLTNKTELVSLADAASSVYEELQLNGGRDPHIWLSIKRVAVMVTTIKDTMCTIDPENADIYTANASAYITELYSANTYIENALANLSSRKFIVFHPAFAYFADDYDLDMYAIEREGSEATAEDLKNMIDFAKENNIKVVFNQAEVDSSWVTSFTQQIEGGSFVVLSPLSGDYINNLKSMADAIASTL